ncbi:protease modulator HflC [Haloferula sargassicola]|uniref:Protein HflC n=1 Tax=Haloferula sargassicola TaxID=490096 RepID=A0ABP9USY9_9BACT
MNPSPKTAGIGCLAAIVVLALIVLLNSSIYTINEAQQAIITQFGKPVGGAQIEAGLHFKTPFIQKVNVFDRRILDWDGTPNEMPTKDKTYIRVDTFGRWRIADPLKYFERLKNERSAQSRLDDILGSETRNAVAKHELIEVVRTTKDRKPLESEEIAEADMTGNIGVLKPIHVGRNAMEQQILERAAPKLAEFGIELLDVRFKRVNYNPSVQDRIFERMRTEREQIAEKFRSEGAGEAAKILGNMERELREIQSTAYREVQQIKGEADAKATAIYADAYNQTPQAQDLYDFTRTLDVYENVIDKDTTLILSTDSELFHLFKSGSPEKAGP